MLFKKHLINKLQLKFSLRQSRGDHASLDNKLLIVLDTINI